MMPRLLNWLLRPFLCVISYCIERTQIFFACFLFLLALWLCAYACEHNTHIIFNGGTYNKSTKTVVQVFYTYTMDATIHSSSILTYPQIFCVAFLLALGAKPMRAISPSLLYPNAKEFGYEHTYGDGDYINIRNGS